MKTVKLLIFWCQARRQLIKAAAHNKKAVDRQCTPAPAYQPNGLALCSGPTSPSRVPEAGYLIRKSLPFPISKMVNPAVAQLSIPEPEGSSPLSTDLLSNLSREDTFFFKRVYTGFYL